MLTEATLGPARTWWSDRHGGVSSGPYATANVGDHVGDDPDAVAENRRRLATGTGLPAPAWRWLTQVHGTAVHVATGPAPTSPGAPAVVPAVAPPVADAAVTTARGLPLVVVTADCAPVALACEGAVGVVHAGHRGLAAGVVAAAVTALRELGRGRVRALIGPCISAAHYEFGAEDLARLVDRFGPDVAGRTTAGTPALDLRGAVRVALARAGVDDVVDSGVCTAASPDHFSYRRDGVTGRQATVVVR